MDPKVKQQLYLEKHKNGIITTIVLLLILPLINFIPLLPTQLKQQAATKEKNNIESAQAQNASSAIKGDIDRNGMLNNDDYQLLKLCFGKPGQAGAPCPIERHQAADLNHDGLVDGIDYNLFVRETANKK